MKMFAGPQGEGDYLMCGRLRHRAPPPVLNYRTIRANPKIFIGYSDITFAALRLPGEIQPRLLPRPDAATRTS